MYNNIMKKELKWTEQGTVKAKNAWQDKLRKKTGRETNGNDFLIEDEILFKALGPYWGQVLKEAIKVGARNILAITSKSLRKTAIVKFIQHYLIARHQWLQAMDLRRTKDQSANILIQAHLDALKFWAEEYNVPWLRETIQQASFSMYFIRDPKRKDNQKIEKKKVKNLKRYIILWN